MVCSRPFDNNRADFEKMWRFIQNDYANRKDNFIWLFSRLGDWKYGLWNEKKYIPSFFRNNAQLWFDEFDQLLGFVLSEDGGNTLFIFTLIGYQFLYRDILEWTIHNWGPRFVSIKMEIHEYQKEAITQIEDIGFRSLGSVAKTRSYDLRKREEVVKIPSGFQIFDMSQKPDYQGKALLYINAFEEKNEVNELDLLKFEYSRESPAYDPRFDLSVITTEGIHVASCVGFNDPAYGVAEIEKVCTHQNYRRQGLADAVIRVCLQRLIKQGIERAYITGYSGEAIDLYEKLSPCGHKEWFHYELAM